MTPLDIAMKTKLSLSIKPDPLRPTQRYRKFDQVVKGDVKISKCLKLKNNNNDYSHKIKFDKIGKFLQYQVWDPKGTVQITHLPRDPSSENHPKEFNDAQIYIKNNPSKVKTVDYNINEDREVVLKNAKEWVKQFNNIRFLHFTPTTVMQVGYKKYVFVIKKVKINKKGKTVFYISTKEILVNNNSEQMEKLKKIPKGEYKNVRFDIDYGQSIGGVCNGNVGGDLGTSTCSCPANSYITTMGANWIDLCQYDSCTAAGRGSWTDVADVCWLTYNNYCNWCSSYCWSDGIGSCWAKGWLGIPYSPGVWQRGIDSYALAEPWDSVPGWICNSESILYNSGGSNSGGICALTNENHGTTCWNSSNNSQQCCPPTGESFCCPPGSSC
jgi:hypothetical protein